MSWDQLRLFELPDEAVTPEPVHFRVAVEFPGPGYDHVVVDIVNDALSRLCYEQGLFPHRIAVDVELGYIDERWFDDSSTIGGDSSTTDPVSAPIGRPQLE